MICPLEKTSLNSPEDPPNMPLPNSPKKSPNRLFIVPGVLVPVLLLVLLPVWPLSAWYKEDEQLEASTNPVREDRHTTSDNFNWPTDRWLLTTDCYPLWQLTADSCLLNTGR